MRTFLPKRCLLLFLAFVTVHLFAGQHKSSNAQQPEVPVVFLSDAFSFTDTIMNVTKRPVKICSCQVLELQSTNHRQRNIALFAEKTNGRSLFVDMSRINRVMEKEKKHMQSFFYDKLTVVNIFTEVTDCRSFFTRLKTKNKSLLLYDILNADVRR